MDVSTPLLFASVGTSRYQGLNAARLEMFDFSCSRLVRRHHLFTAPSHTTSLTHHASPTTACRCRFVYWVTFLLTYIIIPVTQEYLAAGEFTKKGRLYARWVAACEGCRFVR